MRERKKKKEREAGCFWVLARVGTGSASLLKQVSDPQQRKLQRRELGGAFQVVLVVNNPPANAGDIREAGSIPGSGRFPGGGNGNRLQYSSLENSVNREAWWATVHRITKSWTRLKWLNTQYILPCDFGFSSLVKEAEEAIGFLPLSQVSYLLLLQDLGDSSTCILTTSSTSHCSKCWARSSEQVNLQCPLDYIC